MKEEESKLAQHILKQLGRGACVGRRQGANEPFSAWHRDIGQCWHLLATEAISATQAMLYSKYGDWEKDEEVEEKLQWDLETLDTISKILIAIYTDSIQDNLAGIKKFEELYAYLYKRRDGKEIYATFSGFFVQTLFCYMFTSMEMAIGLPQKIDQDLLDYSSMMNMFSLLEDDTRKQAMKEMMEKGAMPTSVNYAQLLKRTDPFIDVIREDQQRQYDKIKREKK